LGAENAPKPGPGPTPKSLPEEAGVKLQPEGAVPPAGLSASKLPFVTRFAEAGAVRESMLPVARTAAMDNFLIRCTGKSPQNTGQHFFGTQNARQNPNLTISMI
jgi:hypothetical protein